MISGSRLSALISCCCGLTKRVEVLEDASGTGAVIGANPSAVIGLSLVPGVAPTFLRSDGAPPLSQAIAPTWTDRHIFGVSSIVSVPAVSLTGTWFSGGTGTTTKPHMLIEKAGTASTAWSTAGTGLGINAATGFAGNMIDTQLNGVSSFKLNQLGDATFGSAIAAPAMRTVTIGDSARVGQDIDKLGGDCLIRPGVSTGGTAANNIIFQTCTPGTAGTSAAQTFVNRVVINSSATNVLGNLSCSSNITLGGNATLFWNACGGFQCGSDGIIRMFDAVGTGFKALLFGGSTTAFPGIFRNGAVLNFIVADNTAGCAITALSLTTSSPAFMNKTSVALANGAAAAAGTLTNAPVAGNPTKWIPISDNGVTRYIPAW